MTRTERERFNSIRREIDREDDMMANRDMREKGHIYVVAMSTEGRFKIGWSAGTEENVAKREKEGQRWDPDAKLLHSWPARKGWERLVRYAVDSDLPVNVAIAQYALTSFSQNYAGQEVIYNSDAEKVKMRGEEILSILGRLPMGEEEDETE